MVLEAIKDIYYSIEEKWYNFWDKVDTKIPVHGVLDAIDSVIPSLVLFLAIIFLLIITSAYFFLSSFQTVDATFKIISSDGKAVEDTIIKAKLIQNENLIKELSARTDAGGMIAFMGLALGQEIIFDINISKGTSNAAFTINGPINETIRLSAPSIIFEPIKKIITVRDAIGLNPIEDIQLEFSCANSASLPEPRTAVYAGTKPVEVIEPINCRLQATIKNPKYKQKTYLIDSVIKTINLENYEEQTIPFKIKIRSNDYPVNDTSFKIKLSGKKEYEAVTGSASEATIQVTPDTYSIVVSDPRGNYGLITKTQIVDRETEIIIPATKSVKSRATIKTIDSATGAIITEAMVTAKDSAGRELETKSTNTNGTAVFAFTELGTYSFTAKKLGDITTGYFQKETTQALTGDANITIGLEKITRTNAGRVKVKVIDQDNEPVINAKVMLKHAENDGIVDLFQEKNYGLTDLNGEANLLAGKVEGMVAAYAIKGPFNGTSLQKTIQLDQLNTFSVEMQIGLATIKINAAGEGGEAIDGTAEIQTIDGKTTNAHGLAGLISLEKGKAERKIKAGQVIYVKTRAETYEDYYTAPVMLWPEKTYAYNITMLKTIPEPEITRAKVYNENDAPVQTMAAGKKYYAKILINSDKIYGAVLLHFRVGKETAMDNDIIQIDQAEGSGITYETRGVTYDSEKGYAFDGANLTDGQAKWINLMWNNFGKGTREVKVWFRIKNTAPPNTEIKFYYRAQFDSTKTPPSTKQESFYSDSYESDTYYVGTEAECTEGFCFNSEWLYSSKEQLYMDPPFQLKQVNDYRYHFSLLNNTGIDYGKNDKRIYLSLKVVGDEQEEKRINIKSYDIKDTVGRISRTTPNNTQLFKIENAELTSFEKDTSIDTTMDIEGLKEGAETILIELKSEGKIIYSKELTFSAVKEKDMEIKITPQFIPALINTRIQIDALDEHGDYLPGVSAITYAKEPGIDRYRVDSSETDRMGRAIVQSGALFPKTKIILELAKEGYARQTYQVQTSSQVITFAPEEILVELNTYSQREEIKEISFANLTQEDLILQKISVDAQFKDLINEDALQGHFSELAQENKLLKGINIDEPAPDSLDIDLLKIRLANSITESTLAEPITIKGIITATFKEKESPLSFDIQIPITLHVSSEANPGDSCLILKPYKTKATTEKAQMSFDFELLNACTSNGTNIALDNLAISSSGDIPGIAEASIRSASGTSTGRTALDGGNRTLLKTIKAGEKLFGTITFAPSEEAIGKSIPLQISLEAKFNGTTIKTNPSTLTLTANVINLKECMSINSQTSTAAFKEKAKITIDASACLGQKIDVVLCKNDPGCSGGADGKITLSKKAFTMQNASQEIEAYAPTYPGTYGITVHARARGTTGFTEIGEVPVSFLEPEGKFFNLNKYELNLIGTGSQDTIILSNKMLTQNINVKANGCVWGQQKPKMNLMNIIAGASMGAALGNMIGSGFTRNTTPKKEDKTLTSTTSEARDAEIDQLKGMNSRTPDQDTRLAELTKQQTNYTSMYGGTQLIDSKLMGVDNKDWGAATKGLNKSGDSVYTTVSRNGMDIPVTITKTDTGGYKVSTPGMADTVYTNNPEGAAKFRKDFAQNYSVNEGKFSYKLGIMGSRITGGTTSGIKTAWRGTTSIFKSKTQANTPDPAKPAASTKPPAAKPPTTTVTRPSLDNTMNASIYGSEPPDEPNLFGGSDAIEQYASREGLDEFTKNPPGARAATPPAPKTAKSQGSSSPVKEYSKISFAGNTPQTTNSGTTGTYGGYGALIGAIVGGLIAYFNDPSQTFDCSDSEYDQIVGFTDYSIFLGGEEITVQSPDGRITNEREVPSDAGNLGFTLEEIMPEWDFTDASISSDETTAIKFTNNSLNDAKPRYGTLTITATKHDHGKKAGLIETTTANAKDYDILCTKPTFGNYWIGKEEEDGKCGVIIDSTYSQKYHIRVLSGEPKGEEAYIKKATTCYMGALTGSTGTEAVPRIKLNWAWDEINANTCDYTNPEYVYCDAAQFTIALIKKLANLDEFFARNANNFTCPPNAVQEEVLDAMNEINNERITITQGFIGIKEIQMEIDSETNETTAKIIIQNNTGKETTSYMSYLWRGASGGTPTAPAPEQWNIPPGESTKVIGPVGTPKHSDPYYFTAVINGPSGNKRAVTRVFLNAEPEDTCWIKTTTRQTAGMPGVLYYAANADNTQYMETGITDETDLYNAINFGVFLTKDAYTQDFLKDFKQHYSNQVFTGATSNSRQKAILEAIDSGNFTIKKKFSGTNEIEAGLYDVWINIDSQNGFKVLDENKVKIEITLLLVKKPSVDSPFYNIPFDGMLGEKGGRQGYGTTYDVEAKNNSTKFEINKTNRETITTFPNPGSNGITKLKINTKTNFDALNTTAATRGQLATASITGNEAALSFTPNYATPVIAKYSLQGTSGNYAYSIENNRTALATGGNLGYWTGAAKSKDFYGANAVETYNNSPDYKLSKLGENVYGYEYNETTRSGTMHLKTTFFTPVDSTEYILTAKEPNASFWTPNAEFLSTTILNGINGMPYNSKQAGRNGTLNSLQDLFNGVKAGLICVTNDGSSSSYWWNPAVIETTTGTTTSLANKEIELIGVQ